ncbi:hypothetical protein HH214_19265 [Mucilaginibacter robiniae]|uniref:Heavy metal binding domain-containing protein n=1 Tax=Mucilaginibacter robiniae TaxID=2728022 RepID=A0A7L5DYP4_9SPHI|nr:heavy metal-binding domain-containing protein [Mucilaginibacter robiniae]QJD94364.1 hypothetical protein HH214_19265 [Mucilaginibacter robiniae]
MKIKFATLFLLAFTACQQQPASTQKQVPKAKQNIKEVVQYTCPMHPEIITNKPGTCPKCGMDLVKKTK